ncbi:hypothetical protein Mame01_04880 [Microbispora amethystogenes]|nr:hypothetical protein Mame01_04880 [Microbispora amethystogenes]
MSAREAIGGRHAALPQLRSSVVSGCPGPLIDGYDAHGAALTVPTPWATGNDIPNDLPIWRFINYLDLVQR